MLDIAEATDRIETDRELIHSLGRRCLGFLHKSGVRGNPNSGLRMRETNSRSALIRGMSATTMSSSLRGMDTSGIV